MRHRLKIPWNEICRDYKYKTGDINASLVILECDWEEELSEDGWD
jgi:hypothetical protein